VSLIIKRIPSETVRQYAALCAFAHDGLDRSLPKLAASEHIALPTLRSWSARFNWHDRVSDYDLQLVERQQNAQDLALAAKIADWTQRQDALRELEFEMSLRLIKRAREILADPRTHFQASDALRALELASELGRRACGLSLEPQPLPPPDPFPNLEYMLERAYGNRSETQLENTDTVQNPRQNTVS
jgi:hypothetical protein